MDLLLDLMLISRSYNDWSTILHKFINTYINELELLSDHYLGNQAQDN